MIDRSISRRYRWKVQGRLAVLEYAAVHGIRACGGAVRLGPEDYPRMAGSGARSGHCRPGPALPSAATSSDSR
jgi:hypothetical protein